LNLYQLSKYFEGTVAAVYFVIELPDAWGPVNFYQTLGLVNASAFNKISLGNGYTAYLYNIAPSAGTPSDYYQTEPMKYINKTNAAGIHITERHP
jgi:hypothetical protein